MRGIRAKTSGFLSPSLLPASRAASGGFSLLELLAVIVVIGVLISIFTLSIGSFDDDETSEHVRRLQALIDLAMEEATMQGRELGLRFYQHGYEFSVRVEVEDEDGVRYWIWQPIDQDRLLKPRDLGETHAIDLFIEDKEVDLDYDREENDDNDQDEYLPQIFIFSSGDLLPRFAARVRPSYAASAILLSAETDGTTEVTVDDF